MGGYSDDWVWEYDPLDFIMDEDQSQNEEAANESLDMRCFCKFRHKIIYKTRLI